MNRDVKLGHPSIVPQALSARLIRPFVGLNARIDLTLGFGSDAGHIIIVSNYAEEPYIFKYRGHDTSLGRTRLRAFR
jgi:hypothetical protein